MNLRAAFFVGAAALFTGLGAEYSSCIHKQDEYTLSNGITIHGENVSSVTTVNGCTEYKILLTRSLHMTVFDHNDGKPYHFIRLKSVHVESGKPAEGPIKKEQSTDMTYGGDLAHRRPLWDPSGFHDSAAYRQFMRAFADDETQEPEIPNDADVQERLKFKKISENRKLQ